MYKTLPAGTALFRKGQSPQLSRDAYFVNGNNKDSLEIMESAYHGNLYEYILLEDVKVLNMNRLETVEFLRSRAKTQQQLNSLNQAFPIKVNRRGNRYPARNSDSDHDKRVANLIRNLGLSGFTKNRVKGFHHSEILLLNSKEKILLRPATPDSPAIRKPAPPGGGNRTPNKLVRVFN